MNTTSGVLCKGPRGPSGPSLQSDYFGSMRDMIIPPTVDMLESDTSFRFFSKFGPRLDHCVLSYARRLCSTTDLDDMFPGTAEDHQSNNPDDPSAVCNSWQKPPRRVPMNVIGGLRFDTFYSSSMEAVARWPEGAHSLWEWEGAGYRSEKVLDGGLTRLELDPSDTLWLQPRYSGWRLNTRLSQRHRAFNALGVTEGKEEFFLVRLKLPSDTPEIPSTSSFVPSPCQYRNSYLG
uniref:Uncharacterized protein n=2 Tax=Moniliophthora roreri TaxID=221103 RepID=A0A0W0FQZ7_MONRR